MSRTSMRGWGWAHAPWLVHGIEDSSFAQTTMSQFATIILKNCQSTCTEPLMPQSSVSPKLLAVSWSNSRLSTAPFFVFAILSSSSAQKFCHYQQSPIPQSFRLLPHYWDAEFQTATSLLYKVLIGSHPFPNHSSCSYSSIHLNLIQY